MTYNELMNEIKRHRWKCRWCGYVGVFEFSEDNAYCAVCKKQLSNEVDFGEEVFRALQNLPGRVPDVAYPEDDDL